jgi:mono/diheme cytochrome c family protein
LLPDRLISHPPVIPAGSPRERAVLGYLSANCGGCHNATDPLSSVGMYLKRSADSRPEVTDQELKSVIGHWSRYQIPEKGPYDCNRISPGDPATSAILYRMSTRDPYRQMPPLGSKIVDQEAVDLITKWIQEDLVNKNGDSHYAHH